MFTTGAPCYAGARTSCKSGGVVSLGSNIAPRGTKWKLILNSTLFLVIDSCSEWVEALGWYQQEDKNNVTGTGKEWVRPAHSPPSMLSEISLTTLWQRLHFFWIQYYHWKADELKRVNPSALVPTLIPVRPNGQVDEEHAVFESLVTIDYIDAVSGATGKDRLVSDDPYEAARCRIWADKVNRDCCSPY